MSSLRSRRGGLSIGKHAEAVKEIPSEGAGRDGDLQVSIRGGNHADIGANELVATHALKLPLLQHTQQCNLGFRREITDFVEEDRAAFRKFEPADAPLQSAR